MFTTRNRRDVFIGKAITKAALAATDYPSSLQDGEIAIMVWDKLNNKEKMLQATGCTFLLYPKIRFVTKEEGQLKYSSWIDGRGVKTFTGSPGVAAQEQIYAVGYSGTAGTSIDITGGTRSTITITYTGDKAMFSEQALNKMFTSDYVATPTQRTIALDLTTKVNFDEGTMVKAETLNSGTAATFGTASACGVTFASDIVTLTGTVNTDTEQTIGAILRLGNDVSSIDPYTGATLAASGRTSAVPVYIVVANSATDTTLTATQVRVHTPYQGPTDAALTLATNCGIVTAGTDWGVKLTSKTLLTVLDQFPYFKQRFKVGLKNFGATSLSKTQEAKRGNGVIQLVKEDEYEQKAQNGALNDTAWPRNSTYGNTQTVAGTLYGTVAIEHVSIQSDTIEGTRNQPDQFIMYLAEDGSSTPATQWAGGGATNNPEIETNLESWIASTPIAIGGVTI